MKDLNLVPKSYILQKKRRESRIFYTFFGLVITIVVAIILVMPLLKIQQLKSRAVFLDQNVKDANKFIEIEKEFNTLKTLYMQRENEAKRLWSSGIDILKIVEKIEAYLPEKIFIMSINISESGNGGFEISLRGISESEDEIAAFANYIRNDEYFSSINISSVNKLYTAGSEGDKDKLKSSKNEPDEKSTTYGFNAVIYLMAGK